MNQDDAELSGRLCGQGDPEGGQGDEACANPNNEGAHESPKKCSE
jgi:hypothetical protein